MPKQILGESKSNASCPLVSTILHQIASYSAYKYLYIYSPSQTVIIGFSLLFCELRHIKKAAQMEVRQKQRAVIEFLVLEGETTSNIHKRLQNVYKDEALDFSTVYRWVRRLGNADEPGDEEEPTSLSDKHRTGRPLTSVNATNKAKADQLIRANRRISLDELSVELQVSHGSAHNLVKSLGFSKVCARWVPRQLTAEHKTERRRCCTELLALSRRDENFFERIITGDETWVHHYEPESKRQSMEWRHPSSPKTKKFKTEKSAGKIMATVFWDVHGMLLTDFSPQGATINSDAYIATLKRLKARIRRVRPNLDMESVLFHHDNARPHTSARTRETITSFGWTTLPHPAYSPDLAPSDFHLFGPMKEALRGQHYRCDEEVKTAVKNWLKDQPAEFYEAGIRGLAKRWTVAIERDGDYVEK